MLESKIEALTLAVAALTAAMTAQTGAPIVAQQAAQAAPASFAPPTTPALTNGMPGGPFPPQAAPVVAAPSFAPPAAPGAPFTDLAGCTKYAMAAFEVLSGKGKPELVTQLIQHLCGSNSINDLPTTKYGEFYTLVEQQKAL